jgi:hypothetical protein
MHRKIRSAWAIEGPRAPLPNQSFVFARRHPFGLSLSKPISARPEPKWSSKGPGSCKESPFALSLSKGPIILSPSKWIG